MVRDPGRQFSTAFSVPAKCQRLKSGCVKGSLEEAAGHAALLSAALPGRQAGRQTAGEGEGEGWHERACGWVGRCAESML